ncbi:PAS domain S-box protein [uncultured Porticoccus sp.]|uniref:PAS domain S-box protein n=1 Tax=uncultured Porticoccus sp. TaxID=1256050 RepID=UPI0030DBA0F9
MESFYENHKPEHAESILSFLAVLHDPMIAIKENGKIVQANNKAQELFGYHRNEFLKMTVEDLLPSNLHQLYRHFKEIFIKKPSPGPMGKSRKQYALFNRMGEKIYVEVFLSPIIGPEGNITIATIRDVTSETVGRRALINVMKENFSKTRQDFFDSLALFLFRDLKAQWVAIGKLTATKDAIQTISFLSNGQHVDNVCYPLAGMPCNMTIKSDEYLILDQLQQAHPSCCSHNRMDVLMRTLGSACTRHRAKCLA